MSTLHLMIGIPGSGKSTYVDKLLKTEEGKNLKLVSAVIIFLFLIPLIFHPYSQPIFNN